MNQARYEEIHTCTRKPQCSQIVGYLIVALLLLAQFMALIPNLQNEISKYILGAITIVLFLTLACSTIQTSRIDPVDPVLVTFLNGQRSQILKIINTCLYCDTCRSYVKSTSKHCKICNRCVDHFDHHCIWINNCIGQQNYKCFVVMVSSACLYLLVFLISVAVIWKESNWNNYKGYMIFLWLCFALAIPFFLLITSLLAFHFYLIFKGLTTYEFMTKTTIKQKEERSNQEIQNKTQVQLDNNKVKNTYYQTDQIIFRQRHNTPQRVQNDNSSSKQPSQSSLPDHQQRLQTSSKQKSKHQTQILKVNAPPEKMEKFQQQEKEELFKYKKRSKSLKFFGESIEVKSLESQISRQLAQQYVQATKSKQPTSNKQYYLKRVSIH